MVDLHLVRVPSCLYEFVLPGPEWQLWFPTGNQKPLALLKVFLNETCSFLAHWDGDGSKTIFLQKFGHVFILSF